MIAVGCSRFPKYLMTVAANANLSDVCFSAAIVITINGTTETRAITCCVCLFVYSS